VRDIDDQGRASKLFERGEAAFHRGYWREALRCFASVVDAVPGNLKTRLRIADALLNAGRRDLAIDVYSAVADHAMKAGHPLIALVATKMLLLLDPEAEELLAGVASLYARDSDRVDALWEGPALVLVGDEPVRLVEDDDDLARTAAARARAVEGTLPWPRHLPAIPLLSHLDEDAFATVAGRLQLRRFADGEIIVHQGERGESFFLLADGEVLVKRDVDDDDGGVTLARLRRGSVFGELALISDEPRHASVVARGDVDVLELRCSDLVVASATTDGVSRALKVFTRERFLRNLTATHPFFAPLSREDRHRVMERFDVLTFAAGEPLIVEGRRGPGVFLILSGAAVVEKAGDAGARGGAAGAGRVHLATLRASDLCGEMSMLSDAPTNATITASDGVEALFLGRDAFKEVVAAYPELLRYLATLTDERLRANRALLHGHGLLEDDEHVML
jgi:CRP-like cAMP-binding protein